MNIFTAIFNAISKFFTVKNVSAVEAWVAKVAPEFEAELIAFSAKLSPEFASLEKLAFQAIHLYQASKGVTISKSLAIQLAQTVFTANQQAIVTEAEKLLGLSK